MENAVKERPILFSAPMVRANLEGRKTQTRRVIKSFAGTRQPLCNLREHGASGADVSGDFNDPYSWGLPYAEDGVGDISLGQWPELWTYGTGDRLWVRETWSHTGSGVWTIADTYNALGGEYIYRATNDVPGAKWWPSIHMPRRASRITLEITGVRVERPQDISEADAIAEGCKGHNCPPDHEGDTSPQEEYRDLWQSINGHGSWDANPWVWVIEYRLLTPPES